jgi:hypothetical protein
MVSTNKKNLNSSAYSNCPYSIQRRMHYILTVRARREVQRLDSEGRVCGIDTNKVSEYYRSRGYETTPDVEDIWDIDVEVCIPGETDESEGVYEPVYWKGRKLSNMSLPDLLPFFVEKFEEHRQIKMLF